MSSVYCGAKQPPRSKRVGSVSECRAKRQLRLFGLKKAGISGVQLKTSGTGKIYCGAKKVPPKRKHGSATQCKSKRQLRRWGVFSTNSVPVRTSLLRKRSAALKRGKEIRDDKAAKVIQRVVKEKKQLAKKRSLAAKRIQQLTRRRAQLKRKLAQEKSKKRSAATRIQKIARGKAVRRFEKQRKLIESKIISEEKKKNLVISKERKAAANKIAAMQKMRMDRKAHLKLMKRVNAAQHRRGKLLNEFINKRKQLTGKKLIHPSSMVNGNPKVISKAETGSGAVVFSVPLKWGIRKGRLNTVSGSAETGTTLAVKINIGHLPQAMHEKNIYDLVNNLVDHNVTPFVMKTVGKRKSMSFDTYHPSIQKEFTGLVSPGEIVDTIPFITESACNGHVMSLGDLMDKNTVPMIETSALLFQLYYTLECFNQIGLRHNDLHHNNILVVKRTGLPANSYREFKYFDYVQDKERSVLVPVTKYEIRIFDFDRSQKAKTPTFGHFINMSFGTKDEFSGVEIDRRRKNKLKSIFAKSIDDEKQWPDLWDNVGEEMAQKHHNAQYDTFKLTTSFSTWYDNSNNVKKFLNKINDNTGHSIMYTPAKLKKMSKEFDLDARLFNSYHFPIRNQPVMSGRHKVLRHDLYLSDFVTCMDFLSEISDTLDKRRDHLLLHGKKLETYNMNNLYV